MKSVIIGSDHAGFSLKQKIVSELQKYGFSVDDVGVYSDIPSDYPDIAHNLCDRLSSHEEFDKSGEELELQIFGILVCGSGIGMSIAANRHKYIRAALCHNEESAKLSRQHNNANIICIGERISDSEMAMEFIRIFSQEKFVSGRHVGRIKKI